MEFLFAWLALGLHGTHLTSCADELHMDLKSYFKNISCGPFLHLNLVYGSAGELRTGSPPSRSALLSSVPFQPEHSRTPETTGRFWQELCVCRVWPGRSGKGQAPAHSIPSLAWEAGTRPVVSTDISLAEWFFVFILKRTSPSVRIHALCGRLLVSWGKQASHS